MPTDTPVEIQPLQQHQLQQVAQWQHAERARHGDEGPFSARIDRLQAHLNTVDFPLTYVAVQNNILIGCASLVYYSLSLPQPQLKTLWLSNVFVMPAYRKQGIGSALVQYGLELADQKQLASLQLFTAEQRKFYCARGWKWLRQARVSCVNVDIMSFELSDLVKTNHQKYVRVR